MFKKHFKINTCDCFSNEMCPGRQQRRQRRQEQQQAQQQQRRARRLLLSRSLRNRRRERRLQRRRERFLRLHFQQDDNFPLHFVETGSDNFGELLDSCRYEHDFALIDRDMCEVNETVPGFDIARRVHVSLLKIDDPLSLVFTPRPSDVSEDSDEEETLYSEPEVELLKQQMRSASIEPTVQNSFSCLYHDPTFLQKAQLKLKYLKINIQEVNLKRVCENKQFWSNVAFLRHHFQDHGGRPFLHLFIALHQFITLHDGESGGNN